MTHTYEGKVAVVTGENVCVDGGMTKLMICRGEHGWTYAPEGGVGI